MKKVDMKRVGGEIRGLIKSGGYGFIRTLEDRVDIYFHCSELINAKFDDLKLRDRVTCLLRERSGRIYGIDVLLVDAPR